MNANTKLSKVQAIAALASLLASFFLGFASPTKADSTSLLITGVIDGPLSGGLPKAVEFYVLNNITDLSIYGFGSANNGGGTDGEEFTFPADSATAGDFIYVATEATEFTNFFGFAPNYTDGSAPNINGDDAIELFQSGAVVDVFGDINVDGTGQPWEYMDGWAYRVDGTGPDGTTFTLANWSFSGPNALDGETSNATATTPFPTGTYLPGGGDTPPSVSNTTPGDGDTGVAVDADVGINFSEDVTVTGAWFDISCTNSGGHTAAVSGGPQNYTLDPDSDFDNGETCTVSIYAAQVSDTDADDPPDNMTEDHSFNFETVSGVVTSNVIINEVDADQAGTDSAEFVELYDGGDGNTDLTGLVLVLFNGSDDASYTPAIDLDGYSTNADGYFVVCGDEANVANCDLDVSPDTNLIQNGADAVALYVGDAGDFPNDTPVTTSNLLDAIVYDTNDSDDAGLLVLLNAGQPQVNEDGAGGKDNHSNQRCANGTGGQRNTDTYAQHPPTPGEGNFCACGDPATFIHDIQGHGASSPEVGNTHVIEGVVVGDFQGTDELKGFFLQEEDADADADPTTSEGIFVYDNGFGVDVSVGDVARVMGDVAEYHDLTELNNVSNVAVCDPGVATAATVNLPVASLDVWERYEGMLINIPQTLYATGNYNQGRYGEVDLSVGDRLDNPTNVVAPGAPALALQDLNDRSRIQLDDGSTVEHPSTAPYVGVGNTLRAGDTIPELTGVLGCYDDYEVHPTGTVNFTRVNTRDATPPAVGGTLKVASFNVLNYFNGDGLGGGFPTSRGADTPDEFNRQRDKIISAISIMDADVIGLMEIENDATPNSAIEDLVVGLNVVAGAGTYDFIDTGIVGSDQIRVAFIHKPGTVTPVGPFKILDSSVDPTFIDTKNRPVLAQTFEQNSSGARFTPVVNHLKSKGSACDDVGDPDMGDGQGNCNQTRTDAATALVNWLATDPTGSGDPDFLIIGDLNAYAMEDPITAIKNAGYTNLVESFIGADAYSYVYYGQAGYLDHALASAALTPQVTGVVEWHINADEPAALDYNDHNQPVLYNVDSFRASDHDPVVVGLDLEGSSGTIIIQKVTDPAGGMGFGFDDNIAAPNSFNLNHGGMRAFNNVATGSYIVTETDPTVTPGGYSLTNLDCAESGANNSFGTVGTRTATINLEAGETVTCTFTNTLPNVETATGTGIAAFESDKGAIQDLAAIAEGTLPPEGKPDLDFPHGFFSFNITGLTPCAGETVIVTITLPSNVPVGTQYWKYHANEGGWIQIPMGSDDGDNVITITLQDGGLGDDDGVCNGVIVDQGGPGQPPAPPPVPVGGIAVPVNKLGLVAPWLGLAALASLAALTVALVRRRRG